MPQKPFTIAISGKGGTGKTTISSLLVRSFIELGEAPVLAVDADPNANLHEALGVTVRETLGSMREEAFTRTIPPGMNRHDYVKYRFRQALVEAEGFDLAAMGRPEGSGCYCFANDLLSECMLNLERDYHFIVIDTEAGMEHISRGTIGKMDMLLIVSDPGARGLRTISRIRGIATQLGLENGKIHIVLTGTTPDSPGRHRGRVANRHLPVRSAVESAVLPLPRSADPGRKSCPDSVRALAEKIRAMAREKDSGYLLL